MVLLSRSLLRAKSKGGFVDHVRIYVRGGPGGQGLPKYGGQGGQGGNVVLVAHQDRTLKQLVQQNAKKRFVGNAGENSTVRALLGAPGEDLHLDVPPGVCVLNDAGRILGELNHPGDRVLVARGGVGARLETGFLAQKGHATSVHLDLKLIADVGIVGFPNAGKSTFLAAISRAAPKIASYPFTTLKPQIGVMQYGDLRQISVADLPGLIEGAHVNIGMGHHFLKHVERTKLLLFLVDVNGFQLSPRHPVRSALETVLLLNKELQLYKDDLLGKPCVLALNKLDVLGTDVKVEELTEQLQHLTDAVEGLPEELVPKTLVYFDEIVAISAKEKHNTEYLKKRLRHWLDVNAEITRLKGEPNHSSDVSKQLHEHYSGSHYI